MGRFSALPILSNSWYCTPISFVHCTGQNAQSCPDISQSCCNCRSSSMSHLNHPKWHSIYHRVYTLPMSGRHTNLYYGCMLLLSQYSFSLCPFWCCTQYIVNSPSLSFPHVGAGCFISVKYLHECTHLKFMVSGWTSKQLTKHTHAHAQCSHGSVALTYVCTCGHWSDDAVSVWLNCLWKTESQWQH